ncbi:50S ribosomal protein L18 [Dehalococcoidia bacterium]|nr:50S ribosomal protein L18 [Dehalococcoidia bacterium]
MAKTAKTPRAARVVRHRRIRQTLAGTSKRPRLTVFRSLTQIYAQVVNDTEGHTLTSASSLESETKGKQGNTKTDTAKIVGQLVAQRAKKLGISEVVFDRSGYKYHGRVQALADAAREGGLKF